VGAPEGFARTLGELPPGVTVLTRAAGVLDVAVVFATRESVLARRVPPLVRALAPDGGLWIAWPKKASKVATDLTFDAVQRMGLAAGLVDNKSASMGSPGDPGGDFQGLRFVYRLTDRPARRQQSVSAKLCTPPSLSDMALAKWEEGSLRFYVSRVFCLSNVKT